MTFSKKILIFIISIIISIAVLLSSFLLRTFNKNMSCKIIHNKEPKWGRHTKVKLEYIRKYGDQETSEIEYVFASPTDIVADHEGLVYIIDYDSHHVRVFDKAGRYLRTLGQMGEGPGDLFRPTSIDIGPDGSLYICSLRGVKVFDRKGQESRQIKTSKKFWEIRCLDNKELLCYDFMEPVWRENEPVPLFRILSPSGEVIREFGTRKMYTDRNEAISGNSLSAAIDKDGNIYMAFEYQNEIRKYSSTGKLLFVADRPLNYKLTSTVVDEIRTSRSLGTTITMERPKMSFVSSNIGVDGKGRVWVMTFKRQPPESPDRENPLPAICEYEIFSPDGYLLGKIPLFHDHLYLSRMRIFGDRLFLIERFSEASAYEYHIVENE